MISKHKDMIKLYYSSKSSVGKQTHSYLNASLKDLLAIDVTKTNVTGSQWKEMAEHLKSSVENLMTKNHPSFKKLYDTNIDLDDNGWIKVLDNNPEVLVHPIVIVDNTYIQIKNQSDIKKILEPNSKGINEKQSI